MAPEFYEGDDEDPYEYTVAVDSWSLGCLLYRLLNGKDLFKNPAQVMAYQYKKRPSIRDGLGSCSDDTIGFLEQLIEPKEMLRALPEKALGHPWFAGNLGKRTISQKLADYCLAVREAGLRPRLLQSSCPNK